ncbi:hypothetical protein K3495_g12712 [Podosphaera aphanis]|nr:hypothetical protein K3495_g12712 [Podosphaera aphanis]
MADNQDTKGLKTDEISWENQINLSTASPADLSNYTAFKVNFYEEENVSDSNLWELFQDNFRDFTVLTFSQIKLRVQQVLRDCLRSRGVYISKNSKRKTISQTLFHCLQEEEQHEWRDENLDDILNENYIFKSPKLARRIAKREDSSTSVRQQTIEPLETHT